MHVVLMFVIRRTSKVDGPQRRDKSTSVQTQPRFKKKKDKWRMFPFQSAPSLSAGQFLLVKPGGPGDAGSVARQGMSEHGSPQQDIRVV